MKKNIVKIMYALMKGRPASICFRCHVDTSDNLIVEERQYYPNGGVYIEMYCWQCIKDYDAAVLMREATKGWLKIVFKDGEARLTLADRPELVFGYGRG